MESFFLGWMMQIGKSGGVFSFRSSVCIWRVQRSGCIGSTGSIG